MTEAAGGRAVARRARRRACWLAPAIALGLACTIGAAGAAPAVPAAPGSAVQLEALTWPELAERVAGGATTVLVPIGGTEQNGPHMVLGKHNVRVKALAEGIARALDHTLVAPVLAYVPEGAIDPPAAHMRFAGTISIPEAAFESLLESTARSLRRHGFREVVLLGDHGGYQKSLDKVAGKLNREWAGDPAASRCRVHALSEYYRAAQAGHAELLAARGFGAAEIGSHAGLADTALTLAIDPSLVRLDKLQQAAAAGQRGGVYGDPRRATAELGQPGVDRIVAASVAAIRERTRLR
ncbi:MAG: creatininase family protein [Burkholderiaceae bacterium]|nr:creatininase family protein [Burkholderiaceae bacterium]